MKSLTRITSVILVASCVFFNSCSCGNNAEIRDGDVKNRSMKDGILLITRKRCTMKPQDFSSLVQCVENESSPETGYGSTILTEFVNINNSKTLNGYGKDIAFYYDFSFNADETGLWAFEFGVDAGIASGCKVDENELWFEAKDLWTQSNYSKVFVKETRLVKGWHRIRIYGLEGCCDGFWRLRFKSPSMKDFEVVSIRNLGVKCQVK